MAGAAFAALTATASFLAAACLAAASPAAAESPKGKVFGISEPNTVGQSPTYPSSAGVASTLADLGAQGHRYVLSWQTIEPSAPRDGIHSYDFSATDRLYAADVAQGVKPLLVLMDAPRWAQSRDLPEGAYPYGMPPGEEHLDDWAAFAAAAARRYPQALGFEIWNEPDAWAFWGRGVLPIDPAAYTGVLAAAHDAIKAESPSMPVIGGAIAPYPSTVLGVHVSVSDFVGGMLDAGAAQYMDAVSLHPYAGGPTPPSPAIYERPVNWLRSTLALRGVSLPIWITESGVSTTGEGAVSEAGQAQALVNLYRWFQAQPDVDALFIHSLFERWTNPSSREVGFGLIHQTQDRKPAFYALREAIRAAPLAMAPTPSSNQAVGAGPSGLALEASLPAGQAVARNRNLRVVVECQGPCSIQAQGSLTVRSRSGAVTTYRLATASSDTARVTTLRMKLRSKARKALSRIRSERLTAEVTLDALGARGAVATRTLSAGVKR